MFRLALVGLLVVGCSPPPLCTTAAGLALDDTPYQTTCAELQPWEDRLTLEYAPHGYTPGMFEGWHLHAKKEIDGRGSIEPGAAGITWCNASRMVYVGEINRGVGRTAWAHEMLHVVDCMLGRPTHPHPSNPRFMTAGDPWCDANPPPGYDPCNSPRAFWTIVARQQWCLGNEFCERVEP